MNNGDPAAQPPDNSPVETGLAEIQIKVAELYAKMAESARSRFDSRRNLEWRAAIGLWTLFGGASGIILTARSWVPRSGEVWGSVVFSFVVVGTYVWLWVRWIYLANRRDTHVAYYWESGIRHCIQSLALEGHKDLPVHLAPPADGEDAWAAMTDPEPNNVQGQPVNSQRKLARNFHSAQRVQILVTTAFAAMFCGAMWSKSVHSSEAPVPSDDESRLTLQGNIEIDGASKIKVGR